MKYLYLFACVITHVQALTSLLEKSILTYDIDARSIGAPYNVKSHVLSKDFLQTLRNTEVFTIVGFPYKTVNTEKKTISNKIDAAEYFSLHYLNSFLREFSQISEKPKTLIVFTDGLAFCDIEGINDQDVLDYEATLKIISKSFSHIQIITLVDLLPKLTPHEMRKRIESCAPSLKKFEEKLKTDKDLAHELEILKKRLSFEFDFKKGQTFLKINPDIAKRVLHRSLQYSTFLKQYRPKDSLRLSVHYQKVLTQKIGIKLSPSSYVTPWHGALVLKQDSWSIQHVEDINHQSQFEKVFMNVNGINLPYFKARR